MRLHPHRWWWRVATALAIGIAVVMLLAGPWSNFLGSATGTTADADPPPCPVGQTVPIMNSPHISQAEAASVRYSSEPPTSGPHFPFNMAPGVYDHPVPDGLTVHALEQGHVAVLYASDMPAKVVDEMSRFAHTHAGNVLLAPHAAVDSGVVLTAWGCLQRLSVYDEAVAETFVARLTGRHVHGWSGRSVQRAATTA